MALRRLAKEYRDLQREYPWDGASVLICSNSVVLGAIAPEDEATLNRWNLTIAGPVESPYADGVFKVKINTPPDYPFKPPRVRFITPIYHPNINGDGVIDLDILNAQWSPATTLAKVIMSLVSLLQDPNFDPSCWTRGGSHLEGDLSMQDQIRLGMRDRRAWRAEAARRTMEHAIPRVDWSHSRTLFLVWVGRHLATREGDALLQPWIAHIVPRVVLSQTLHESLVENLS